MHLGLTLSKYIARRALLNAAGLFVALLALVVLIDFVELMRGNAHRPGVSVSDIATLAVLRAPRQAESTLPFVFLFSAMWTFYQLNRRSELAVMRASGISAWRIILPAAACSIVVGIADISVVNPLSANFMEHAERIRQSFSSGRSGMVRVAESGQLWLRQADRRDHVVIRADSMAEGGGVLEGVTLWRSTTDGAFVERIDAPSAELGAGLFELTNASISKPNQAPEIKENYVISTPFSKEELQENAALPETMSIWELPGYIRLAKAAGFPSARYELRWHDLMSTPLKLCAMVVIAAVFSMRLLRSGGAAAITSYGIGFGFLFYVFTEISEAIALSDLAPIGLAAWAPPLAALMTATTLLLHLEDG